MHVFVFISRDQTSDHSDSAQVSFDGSSIQKVPVELYKIHSHWFESSSMTISLASNPTIILYHESWVKLVLTMPLLCHINCKLIMNLVSS